MNEINLDTIIKDFATDLLNTMLFFMEQPYISASGKRFKGLGKDSTLRNSLTVVWDSTPTIKVEAQDYFKYFDGGRGVNKKRIPFNIILKWIKKKGIRARAENGRFKSMTLNQLAWVIQKSIFRLGIRPRNIIKKTLSQVDELYKKDIETGIQELIDTMFLLVNSNFGDSFKSSEVRFKIKPNSIKAK